MIKCKITLDTQEALRWRELLGSLMDSEFPILTGADTFVCNYSLHTEDWEKQLNRAEAVAFLLRNANIRKLDFEEWDRGTGFLHSVARAHGVLNDLYSALEMCPDWKPPPMPKKGWWRRLREWLNV